MTTKKIKSKLKKPAHGTPEAFAEGKDAVVDPVAFAKSAGLRYVSDRKPGITRLKIEDGFNYTDAHGNAVTDEAVLARIKSLVIPPAWTEVWICPLDNGHLQATGRDARGRKQSRYHPHWREVRDETKYERMIHFGDALPKIRAQIDHDLNLHGLPRAKVLATILRLMETTFIRVGNAEYARDNHSYGLTTMRNKHARVHGGTVTFDFQGKSGVHHTIDVKNPRLAKIVDKIQHLPGQELFQYVDHDGDRHSIDASDVNQYLHDITGEHFTAKDFRTWAGSVLTAMMLREFEPYQTQSQAKKNVVQAIKAVAARLGNTPSVCRKCYVHPAVLDRYLTGEMLDAVEEEVKAEVDKQIHVLKQEEHALLHLLDHHVQDALGA